MKHWFLVWISIFLPLQAIFGFAWAENIETTRFGSIQIERPVTEAKSISFVLLDKAHQLTSRALALELLKRGSVVATIKTEDYFKNISKDDQCYELGGEFERLSQVVQKNVGLGSLTKPLLVGFGPGAGIVYAVLSDASKSFRAGISFDFVPQLPLDANLCSDDEPLSELTADKHSINLLPAVHLRVPWKFSISAADAELESSKKFIAKIQIAQLQDPLDFTYLDSIFRINSYNQDQLDSAPFNADLADLPLIELPANQQRTDYFMIVYSGDGGWANIDKELGQLFSEQGISVVGIDSLSYFWHEKSPQQIGTDLNKILKYYAAKWQLNKAVLIGYSWGANVLPFAVNNINNLKSVDISAVVLLNPEEKTRFEIHFTDWLNLGEPEDGALVAPEVKKITHSMLICVYGMEEADSLCPDLKSDTILVRGLPGDHHYDGEYELVAQTILDALKGA